jgi:hypothetical protein
MIRLFFQLRKFMSQKPVRRTIVSSNDYIHPDELSAWVDSDEEDAEDSGEEPSDRPASR